MNETQHEPTNATVRFIPRPEDFINRTEVARRLDYQQEKSVNRKVDQLVQAGHRVRRRGKLWCWPDITAAMDYEMAPGQTTAPPVGEDQGGA